MSYHRALRQVGSKSVGVKLIRGVEYRAAKQPIETWRIVKGDKVVVNTGLEKGKQGKVARVIRDQNRIIIEGLNMRKRFVQANQQRSGFMYMRESPMHYSNVQLVDPSTNKATKVMRRWDTETGEKVRVAKKTMTPIPKPAPAPRERKVNQATDTMPEAVLQVTYVPQPYNVVVPEAQIIS